MDRLRSGRSFVLSINTKAIKASTQEFIRADIRDLDTVFWWGGEGWEGARGVS